MEGHGWCERCATESLIRLTDSFLLSFPILLRGWLMYLLVMTTTVGDLYCYIMRLMIVIDYESDRLYGVLQECL